jgi:hypothetical protein
LSPALQSLPADYFQPYVGQQQSACQLCNAAANPRLTANSGDAYCLIPYTDTVCTDGEGRCWGLLPAVLTAQDWL